MEQPIEPRKPRPTLYSDEDVHAILERALALQDREFTHEHLVKMADELGISPAQLEAAEAAWHDEQAVTVEIGERVQFIASRRRKAIQGLGFLLGVALVFYLLILFKVAALAGIATALAIPLFFFVLGSLWEIFQAFTETEGDDFEKAYRKWLKKRPTAALPAPDRPKKNKKKDKKKKLPAE